MPFPQAAKLHVPGGRASRYSPARSETPRAGLPVVGQAGRARTGTPNTGERELSRRTQPVTNPASAGGPEIARSSGGLASGNGVAFAVGGSKGGLGGGRSEEGRSAGRMVQAASPRRTQIPMRTVRFTAPDHTRSSPILGRRRSPRRQVARRILVEGRAPSRSPISHNAAASMVVPPVPGSRSLSSNLERRTPGAWLGLEVSERITGTGVTPEERDRVSVVGTAPDPPMGRMESSLGAPYMHSHHPRSGRLPRH